MSSLLGIPICVVWLGLGLVKQLNTKLIQSSILPGVTLDFSHFASAVSLLWKHLKFLLQIEPCELSLQSDEISFQVMTDQTFGFLDVVGKFYDNFDTKVLLLFQSVRSFAMALNSIGTNWTQRFEKSVGHHQLNFILRTDSDK